MTSLQMMPALMKRAREHHHDDLLPTSQEGNMIQMAHRKGGIHLVRPSAGSIIYREGIVSNVGPLLEVYHWMRPATYLERPNPMLIVRGSCVTWGSTN